uniref:Fe2OG dioxygenase domain-containing protein n=1 Tax=Kalanchoe fedtschenkoi TaxID=63787 RepID=A0A7N0ZU51_KALFE
MSESMSYPPLFRHPITTSTVPIPKSEPDSIPIIDLHHLSSENFHAACKNWGLFRLINHGVPLQLSTQLHQYARKVFDLPFESKQELGKSPVSYFWGTPALTPSGSALKGSDQSVNWVEGFNFPVSRMSAVDDANATLDAFRALLDEYGSHLARLATRLYELMAGGLGLDPGLSTTYVDVSTGLIRVYRYPPADPGRVLGMEAHTDSSVLSILSQDDEVSGLEVLKEDEWVQVKPVAGSLVVNLGDMLQVSFSSPSFDFIWL